MCGADKPAIYVAVVTDFGAFRFTLYELVISDVAVSCIIIIFLLAGTKALYRTIHA